MKQADPPLRRRKRRLHRKLLRPSADTDNGFRRDFGVLFGFCLCGKVVLIGQIDVHIFVHQMQDIVFIGACGIA